MVDKNSMAWESHTVPWPTFSWGSVQPHKPLPFPFSHFSCPEHSGPGSSLEPKSNNKKAPQQPSSSLQTDSHPIHSNSKASGISFFLALMTAEERKRRFQGTEEGWTCHSPQRKGCGGNTRDIAPFVKGNLKPKQPVPTLCCAGFALTWDRKCKWLPETRAEESHLENLGLVKFPGFRQEIALFFICINYIESRKQGTLAAISPWLTSHS